MPSKNFRGSNLTEDLLSKVNRRSLRRGPFRLSATRISAIRFVFYNARSSLHAKDSMKGILSLIGYNSPELLVPQTLQESIPSVLVLHPQASHVQRALPEADSPPPPSSFCCPPSSMMKNGTRDFNQGRKEPPIDG